MKIKYQARGASLAGLALLAALVLMMVAFAAQAAGNPEGSTDTSVKMPPSAVLGRIHPTVGNMAMTTSPGSGGGVGEVEIRPTFAGPLVAGAPAPGRFVTADTTGGGGTVVVEETSLFGASSALWIALAALAAGLAIVLWAFVRGRVRQRQTGFDCEASLLGC